MPTVEEFLAQLNAPAQPTPAQPVAEFTPLPVPTLALPLLPYQCDAVRFALGRQESYLALDMGLGKTAIAIAVVVAYVSDGQTPALVVVPPSLRTNWVREFQKFAPQVSVAVLSGTKPHALPNVDVLIIGDSTVQHWATTLAGKVSTLVVDEAHRHKNPDAKRAKALRDISATVAGSRVLMSGTPTPNGRHAELPAQIDVLGKTAWDQIGGKGVFWNHYCPKVDQWSRGNNDTEGLHQALHTTWMLRKRRDEVLNLPNKGRTGLHVEGRGTCVRRYKDAEDNLIAFLHGEGRSVEGAQKAEALVQLTTLRKLAGEAKIEAVAEHVTELLDTPGGVFVVAEHHAVIDGLADRLLKHGVAVIRGGMTDVQKTEAVDAFTSGKKRVLIGQVTSAGVGLTLHGDGLNHRVVFAQLPWTPADLRQAEDRLHRIGQTHDVTVEITLCSIDGRWTIDERLWGLLESKADSTGQLIDGESEPLLDDIVGGLLDTYR
jgi:SWI/SNF-related matrix-associated actin-dependent regulator 1 of chromatin subfamily A